MIEDRELRELFKVESEEYLNSIESILLGLEKQPATAGELDELHRQLHSLKGSARIIGEMKIEMIAHQMEERLASARKGVEPFDPGSLPWFLGGLDEMRGLARQAVKEAPSAAPVEREKEPEPEQARHAGTAAQDEYRIETIRVETRKLDALLTHAGELVVMRTRLERLQGMLEEALAMLEAANRGARSASEAGGGGRGPYPALEARLGEALNALREDNAYFEYIATALDEGVREARLLPFSTLFGVFPRMARDLAHAHGKEIVLETSGGDTRADKRIIEEMKDPIMHILRNAIDHGVEPPEERAAAGKPREGHVRLAAARTETNIVIEISDDGRGLDEDAIRRAAVKQKLVHGEDASGEWRHLIFHSGFSTARFVTDVSGRGVGLDVVKKKVDGLKGSVEALSTPGAGCVFRIRLPVTLAVARVLIVMAGRRKYAIPSEYVETSIRVWRRDVFPMEGMDTILSQGRSVSVRALVSLLAAGPDETEWAGDGAPRPCVIMSASGERFGVLVDALVDETEVSLKPASPLLKRVRNVSGMTILGDGDICVTLNPNDLLKTLRKRASPPVTPSGPEQEKVKHKVLLVEDSITTRTQEKRILETGGYEVLTAVNGADALSRLAEAAVDAVVSDVLMPEMDGLTLTRLIRQNKAYKELPVILVTTLASNEDRKKGLEAGANAYIPKPSFDQKTLLDTLKRLI